MDLEKKNILIGATGSVATVRTTPIAQAFIDSGYNVKIVLTDSAQYFFDEETKVCEVFEEKDH